MSVFDSFFKLGEKATGGNPTKKALFDYILYWIVFLTFCTLAINYLYSYFFNNGAISNLLWGVVIAIFCWFNYWALSAFRGVYKNMKDASEMLARVPDKKDVDNMLEGFEETKNNQEMKGGKETHEQ